MQEHAKKCIEYLVKDLDSIEKGSISKGDYKTAAEEWGIALMQRQYYELKGTIEQLHCGVSFSVAVEKLRDDLEEDASKKTIELGLQMIRAYVAQTKLQEVIKPSIKLLRGF